MRGDLKLALKYRFVERRRKVHSKCTCDYKGTQRSILCANRKSGRGEAHILRKKSWKATLEACLEKILIFQARKFKLLF